MNLGCKVNSFETESIASVMEKQGYTRVDFKEPSDVCIIFTCAVTNTAAQKSRQMIHRARRNNPNAIVVVAGCYVQVEAKALVDADILVGSSHKTLIPQYIQDFSKNHKRIEDIEEVRSAKFEPMRTDIFENHTRAYLKIQDGCNQFCSYCIIPYARGQERSMDPNLVIEEAKRIVKKHKEIVLTGIHTGRYGREYQVSLAQLIKRLIAEVDGLERLRISSIEITEIDDELIELFVQEPKIAKHFHIPLQSGCNTTLRQMNRPYTTEQFYERLQYIRQKLPDISISTDLIVGFPNESEEDFNQTYNFLKQCAFSFLHVFPYSSREGTKAASMPCQIPNDVKKQRASLCIALSEELYNAYKDQWIGREVDVLIEKATDTYGQGHASEYFEVKIPGQFLQHQIVRAKIVKRDGQYLIGE